ncbi:ABC transporter permease subunit [Turicibacter sanguinis]|uniref:ABC transporter permease subunit n=2 Tax=Turicibacter sanguinis TaxID=154288 RepID=A0A9X4XF04_9FIRM|nr:carbohydrate ABC transporter permease [Turicibacter sanguinis]EFF65160.1 ABC transporter, permease protein [Turicibacter sanguinis PC909]MCU7190583.1 carbohydrate ABC transporter permease [Turicibacter sanguinis]MCU7210643.1 carbohydrate ABC transporter permease [Turicibacter sanguinis]MDB8563949.1 carbohydrate ABC transporter permease [Turicibacter sanguinis]MTK20650.1 ABC transporter permease subunit [Turicibacter sanguinis]
MNKIRTVCTHVFLSIASFISIFPFFWMIVGMTNSSTDIVKGKLTFGSELITNISNFLSSVNLGSVLWTSIKISVCGTFSTLLLCSMAGYAFEIYKSKFKSRLMALLMLSMMMPFAALMVPLFKMFSGLNLMNTAIAVVLPSVATVFMIFFFLQNTKSFPTDLLQSARVDGLNEFQAFFYIFMPTMKSTYAAAAIITFMSYWNSYLWPLIVLQTQDNKTMPLIISSLASAYSPDYGMIMVAIVITTIPTLLIFFLMQKHFVEGMVGAVK